MSLYAVKNDKGELAHIDMDELTWETGFATLWFGVNEPYAKRTASDYGGHVVELIEAPAKVVVSEKEADKLERAKVYGNPADVILALAANHHPDDAERLLRAYVNGYTVEKPKRYVLPMPGTDYRNYQMHGNAQYYAVKRAGSWRPDTIALGTDDAVKRGYTVTQSDIDTAPAWVKAIKPFEVTDDEQ